MTRFRHVLVSALFWLGLFGGLAPALAQEGFRPQDIPKQEHRQCDGYWERGDGDGAPEKACSERRRGCDRDCEERTQYRDGRCDRRETIGERSCRERARGTGLEDDCDLVKGDDTDAGSTQKAGPTISQFVLYAERRMALGDCVSVRQGDLGVRSFAETSQSAQLKIGMDSFIQPSHAAFSPSVAVGHNVTLGMIDTDQFIDDGIQLGSTASFPAAAMPPMPLAPAAASGGPNITISANQALALPPGNYGTLTVNGILLLNPGRYVISKLEVGDFGRIVAITGNVQMTVVDILTAGRHTAIYPAFHLPAQ
jgi:hypothetical protein